MALKSGLTLIKPLGAGFFGEVHLGEDPVHGPVAVKALKRRAGEPELSWIIRREDLLKEGQRLAKAKHDNVVEVYHLVEDDTDDTIHIVMQLCAGGSLQAAFDLGPTSLKKTRDFASQVALGLEALHAREMLHRDIKPSNIMLDAKGRAKIGDFGLVTDELVLGYGSINGYSDHVAIEVYQGVGTSVRSDIWAFGMTFYRLLHGSNWYARSPEPKKLIEKGGFASGLSWLPHIPSTWRRFVRKCMSDDVSTRFQTMQQVNSALARLPVEPNWECSVQDGEISWTRLDGDRKHRAVWITHSARAHSWSAWSEPTGEGRRRTKGQSDGMVSKNECAKALSKVLK